MKHEYETQRVKDDARGRWERVLPDLAPALKDAVERQGQARPLPGSWRTGWLSGLS
jgi:hypothetical protein